MKAVEIKLYNAIVREQYARFIYDKNNNSIIISSAQCTNMQAISLNNNKYDNTEFMQLVQYWLQKHYLTNIKYNVYIKEH